MKKQFNCGIIALIALFTFSTAYSQTSVQWTRTLQLEGLWQGPTTIVAGGQTFPVYYTMDFQTNTDGKAIVMNEWFSDATLGDYKCANLIGYDPYANEMQWYSVDNFDVAHGHNGSWSTPKQFHIEHHSVRNGQAYFETAELRLKANNQKFDITFIVTLDSDTIQIFTGTLTRQSSNRPVINEELTELMIYPNPSSREINILSGNAIDEISITDEAGRLIYHANPNDTDFSLKLESPGIYFVQVTAGSNTETQRIVITK
jgi:hypothetical protein